MKWNSWPYSSARHGLKPFQHLVKLNNPHLGNHHPSPSATRSHQSGNGRSNNVRACFVATPRPWERCKTGSHACENRPETPLTQFLAMIESCSCPLLCLTCILLRLCFHRWRLKWAFLASIQFLSFRCHGLARLIGSASITLFCVSKSCVVNLCRGVHRPASSLPFDSTKVFGN